MTATRSVFSNRFNMSPEQRRAAILQPVPDGTSSAMNALERMGNRVPRIEKSASSLKYNLPVGLDDSIEVDTGMFALYRKQGWETDKRESHIGLVGENYQVITPDMMAGAWDDIIGMKPSNLQFQDGGTSMFMEVKIAEFELKPREDRSRGDLLEQYFYIVNPTNGGGSVVGGIREVRLVCTNGLIRRDVDVEQFKIKHDATAYEHMREWMAHVWNHYSNQPISEVCEAYNRLTEARATRETVKWIMTELYPLPEAPKMTEWDVPRKTTFAQALGHWEQALKKVQQQHDAILGLWAGGGTEIYAEDAMDVLNVFTEWEDTRKGTVQTMAIEAVTGDRAKNKQKAWEMVQEHLSNPVL